MAQAYLVADVGAIEARHELARLLQRQAFDDFVAGTLIRGGGERDARHLGKALVQHHQLTVFRAEIVAPLRHAVRFVDGEQRHFGTLEQPQETWRQQPLRRHVQQVEFAGQQAALHLALIVRIEAGIEIRSGHAGFAQGIHLILHQGDQR